MIDKTPSSANSAKQSILCAVILVVFGGLIYANSLGGPFVLDDKPKIEENPDIRHVWPPDGWLWSGHRPVAYLSFAINYSLHGLDVWGYHVVNVLIHLAAALVLFDIVRRTLRFGDLKQRYVERADWIALGVALIWMAHPLQTQAVDYLIQRMESLMGLFFLLTLWGFVVAQQSRRPLAGYCVSVIACALGMATKEVTVTAPVLVLTFDRVYVATDWWSIFKARKGYYLALFGTWAVLAALMLNRSATENQPVVAENPVTPLEYALTQPEVICHYLKLSALPVGLCLDPWWPVADTPLRIVPYALIILGLLGLTFWALYRYPKWGYLGWWFFLILSPTSTIVPIKDLLFEHRMYLSLAALATLFVVGGYEIVRRRGRLKPDAWLLAIVPAVALVLGVLTFLRNQDYQTALAVWADVVEKAPHNPRARLNYGLALDLDGRLSDALKSYQAALEIDPDYEQASEVYLNIGVIHQQLQDFPAAAENYQKALDHDPSNAKALTNYGIILIMSGKAEQALPYFEKAVELMPDSAEFQTNLGQAYKTLGQRQKAISHFRRALRLDSRYERAQQNLRQMGAH